MMRVSSSILGAMSSKIANFCRVIADAVATPYHIARERARIVAGQRVAVIGAGGGVGVHMLQVAKAFGAFVIAVERDASKLQRLREFAPDALVDASAENWQE